jgi:hypothetical protein
MEKERAAALALRSAALGVFLREDEKGEMTAEKIAENWGPDLAPQIRALADEFWTLFMFWDANVAEMTGGEGFDEGDLEVLQGVREDAEKLTLL